MAGDSIVVCIADPYAGCVFIRDNEHAFHVGTHTHWTWGDFSTVTSGFEDFLCVLWSEVIGQNTCGTVLWGLGDPAPHYSSLPYFVEHNGVPCVTGLLYPAVSYLNTLASFRSMLNAFIRVIKYKCPNSFRGCALYGFPRLRASTSVVCEKSRIGKEWGEGGDLMWKKFLQAIFFLRGCKKTSIQHAPFFFQVS